MITEKLSWPTEVESANTSSLKSQVLQSLKTSDEYRYSFVEEKIQSGLAAQIRAIREQRQLDPKQFAEKLGKKVSWVYRLEDPNLPPPTIPSLLEVARAYDVDLEVRFRPFSAFLNEADDLSTGSLEVASFRDELPELEREATRDQEEAEYKAWLTAHAAAPAPLDLQSEFDAGYPTWIADTANREWGRHAWNSIAGVVDRKDISLYRHLQVGGLSNSPDGLLTTDYPPSDGTVVSGDAFRKRKEELKATPRRFYRGRVVDYIIIQKEARSA
jgi:transcriptional regulator with XRE-family HTH domain